MSKAAEGRQAVGKVVQTGIWSSTSASGTCTRHLPDCLCQLYPWMKAALADFEPLRGRQAGS